MRPYLPATGLALIASLPAQAASDDAWEAFRGEVAAACRAAAEPLFEAPRIRLDPFGSESYGLALVSGKARGADVEIAAICVYDKQTKAVEIGGELPED